jgi:hypothetical protein
MNLGFLPIRKERTTVDEINKSKTDATDSFLRSMKKYPINTMATNI